MELLQARIDRAVIALWLGHEPVETTQIYLDADLALKEKVLATTSPIKGKFNRYRPRRQATGVSLRPVTVIRIMPHCRTRRFTKNPFLTISLN